MSMITTNSVEATESVAREWLAELKERPVTGRAEVVALLGDLGAGKTTFVQAVARELGVTEAVTSPTFVIEKIYHLPSGEYFDHLIHIDCYRLDSSSELQHLGWEEIITDERNLIMIEWGDKVAELLPPDHLTINFTFINETTREIVW